MIVSLIDIFMAVPLVLVPLGLALLFIYGVYQEYKTLGVVMLVLFSWFFVGLLYYTKPAHSAEATMPMSARIINLTDMPLEEAIAFCDERGMICPELRSQWDEITKVQFGADELNEGEDNSHLNDIEPAAGYEEQVYE